MQWLTRHGPFWEDVCHHTPDDWLEWDGDRDGYRRRGGRLVLFERH